MPQDLPADADDWAKFAASCWECGSIAPREDRFACDKCLVDPDTLGTLARLRKTNDQ